MATKTVDKLSIENLLPEVPAHFCFKEKEFSTEEFDVDLFIKKHQNNMPLEQLREDLSIYLRKLRLSLVDLINCDYEEFINLTSNYIDLNHNINNLMYSLTKLRNDVEKSQQEIESTIDQLNENLNCIKTTLKQKKDLNFILKASKMINNIENDLESIKENDQFNQNFNKVSYQMNLINQKFNKLNLNSSYVNQTFKNKIDALNNEIDNYLDKKVEQFIQERDNNGLKDLLEISVLNNQSNQFIDLIFKKVFKNIIQDYVCDLNIDKNGIVKFYDQLFEICENELKLFKDVNTVDFNLADNLISCVSEKIFNSLTINASTLFLAGNPETFSLNFKETINFAKRLLSLNSKGKSHEQFPIFNEIKRKFNCEIYFHIRLLKISNEFSKALEKPIVLIESNQEISNLNLTDQQVNQFDQTTIKIQLIDELLGILNFIWSDQIYINTLFFDFWRLSLLIISRYALFLKNFQFQNNLIGTNFSTNYRLQSLILIRLINESSLLINSIQQIFSTKIKPRIPVHCNEFELTTCLNQSFDTIFIIGLPSINGFLKQVFCTQCYSILNQIKEIPRLYRKTNRDVPSKPSTYIVNCIELFQQLEHIQKSSSNLILEITNEVTDQFYTLANEVLENLQKMEESLMRLKKIQTNLSGNLKNLDKKTTMSDADKIRLQFRLDIYYFSNGIGSLNIDKNNLVNLNALIELVKNF